MLDMVLEVPRTLVVARLGVSKRGLLLTDDEQKEIEE